jgi:glycerol-3-phosphate dehydrogenase
VLVLGAGINGCALARELLLAGVHVCLVDQADISFGTTAYSSRLIHGGLRYLEFGEFDLVRESLAERTRLLRLAPQFVKPLQLFIPVDNRLGGLSAAAGKFLGWSRNANQRGSRRGAWLVRMGLWFYDTYARDPTLPKRAVHRPDEPGIVAVDRHKFRWLLSYYDAQVLYPERFTLALVEDARRIAAERNLRFQIFTYHRAELSARRVRIHSLRGDGPVSELAPEAIVNATGAWVDQTLASLQVPSKRLIGGTKGSHLVTYHARLRECLAGKGIYAEAADGRPIFILPFGQGTLIGTTDQRYCGDPADAVASREELDYLLNAVGEIVPQAALEPSDIDLTYCGVRPLPYVEKSSPAAITRRHWMAEIPGAEVPLYAIIGGKLTTCRSLAEQSADTILRRLGRQPRQNSRQRPLPGAELYPADPVELRARIHELAKRFDLAYEQIEAMWSLCGSRVEPILAECAVAGANNKSSGQAGVDRPTALETDQRRELAGTNLPVCYARWVIRNEWVTTLGDLVERRLMLVFVPRLTIDCLRQLADVLVAEGKLSAKERDREVQTVIDRLHAHYGKSVIMPAPEDLTPLESPR